MAQGLAGYAGTNQTPSDELSFGRRLRRARMRRSWSQAKLAYRFLEVAARYQGAAKVESLVKMISKWEGDRLVPDQYNRHVLAEALGVKVGDLGLVIDPDYVLRPSQSDR